MRSPAVSARVPSRSKTSMGARSVMRLGLTARLAGSSSAPIFATARDRACRLRADRFVGQEGNLASVAIFRLRWRAVALAAPLLAASLAHGDGRRQLRISRRAADRPQPRLPPRRASGEVGACQYGLKEGTPVGVTLCYPPGEGAKAGAFSEYALVASRHTGEGGVFRVDLRSGMMSICFVLNESSVVCTPPAK